MVSVRAFESKSTRISQRWPPAASAGSASAAKRSRSQASEALEISSRRKISRWLYIEWIISRNSRLTSA